MEDMKGIGRTVVWCETARGRVELVRYHDDSLAIRRDGRTLGVWEPAELDECAGVLAAQLVPPRPAPRPAAASPLAAGAAG